MARYIVQLSYKGSNYHGWQVQENAPTVQEFVNKALSTLCNQTIETTGAGRTDTGVHARHYIAHFDSATPLPYPSEKLIYKLNCILPRDIAVEDIKSVHDSFHARFDAISRTYKYFICTKKNPFQLEFSYQLFYPLDVDKMNKAADILLEYHDFTSFSKLHSDVKTNNCKISYACWNKTSGNRLVFTITADRFLHNMVRAVVGTLLEVGKQKITINDFCKIIESKNRGNAGVSAPAQGLFLWEIEYNNL
ncbi:MAG: tRNA pseudouridine(38-40) synthase TruA [Prevotellaceae bacterium]|jgi:tRNA pseudouridine38-40 synthase|nr:tRNA pseudouridine(38-40) synthase TruA [Prevotellaceae bacterium]